MLSTIDCIPCFVRQAAEAVALSTTDEAQRERLLRHLLSDIAVADWSAVPVALSQAMQRTVRAETGALDPYRALKERMNRTALELLPGLEAALHRQPDPRAAAVRLAIAGNLLDAGSKNRIEPEDLPRHLQSIWTAPLVGPVEDFFRAAEKARKILYLADNAGEIIFDRLLVEALPPGRVTVAVRGRPVINDATLEDAEVAGLTRIATVIDNGSDAPGTLLDDCSDAFRSCFANADMVIAKGQGNYETLCQTPGNLWFLLTVKCPVIGACVGAQVGTHVLTNTRPVLLGRF